MINRVSIQMTNLMERLRGAARATMPKTQKAMFEIGAVVMDPLLVFLESYKNQVTCRFFL